MATESKADGAGASAGSSGGGGGSSGAAAAVHEAVSPDSATVKLTPAADGADGEDEDEAPPAAKGDSCYGVLRRFARSTTHAFFRDIEVTGTSNVPAGGPLIVVANHANQFVDPLMLIQAVHRDISFLMAASSFGKPVVGQAAKWLRSVPVVRPQDVKETGKGKVSYDGNEELLLKGVGGSRFTKQLAAGAKVVVKAGKDALEMVVTEVRGDDAVVVKARDAPDKIHAHFVAAAAASANGSSDSAAGGAAAGAGGGLSDGAAPKAAVEVPYVVFPKIDQDQMFKQVFSTLCDNGCIGIFPEGGSTDQTHLLPLKAGVAIMALGAAAQGAKNIKILPCGINYFRGWHYRSRVFVEIGHPIDVPPDLVEQYKGGDRRTPTSKLLEMVTAGLGGVTMQAPDWETLRTVRLARRLYTPKRRLEPSQYLELNRRFILGYEAFKSDPRFQAVMHDVNAYANDLQNRGIKDRDVVRITTPGTCATFCRALTLLTVVGLPVCFVLAPLSVPGLLIGLPVYVYASWGIKETMAKALAKSNVKVAARDVVASNVIVRAITIAPVVTLVTAIATCIVLAIVWEPDRDVVDVGAEVGILVALAVLMWLFIVPLYVSISQRVFETAFLLCRGLRPLFMQCIRPQESKDLRDRRRALALRVRDLVTTLGPELDPRIWEHRVVSAAEIEADRRDTDPEVALIEAAKKGGGGSGARRTDEV